MKMITMNSAKNTMITIMMMKHPNLGTIGLIHQVEWIVEEHQDLLIIHQTTKSISQIAQEEVQEGQGGRQAAGGPRREHGRQEPVRPRSE